MSAIEVAYIIRSGYVGRQRFVSETGGEGNRRHVKCLNTAAGIRSSGVSRPLKTCRVPAFRA